MESGETQKREQEQEQKQDQVHCLPQFPGLTPTLPDAGILLAVGKKDKSPAPTCPRKGWWQPMVEAAIFRSGQWWMGDDEILGLDAFGFWTRVQIAGV